MKATRIINMVILLVPIALASSCRSQQGAQYDAAERQALLEGIAAHAIEIVAPFTKPASFDDDALPDGISVVLSAVDKQGERIKITGQIVFELYTYRPASADPKGEQLQTWQLELAGDRDQRTYWHHTTRMYEFPLQVKRDTWPGGTKFVLLARYSNPWNEHLQDQAILDLSGMVSDLKERARSTGGS
ncbi:MAG: hypothetical protein IID41_16395 [Planctomycetes bacterium]|nr:hypothetical protein [Planctomycetota bacterium]